MNYLEWINQCTPTRWWHDSGNPDEIELAIRRGASTHGRKISPSSFPRPRPVSR